MNNCLQLKIEPRDLLFFRDARPMEGDWTGRGAEWPSGASFHGALLAALQRELNEAPGGTSFSSLRTVGLFPHRGEKIYFPTPQDILPDGSVLHPRKLPAGAGSNLPKPLTRVLVNEGKPSKDQPPRWLSSSLLLDYLHGKTLSWQKEEEKRGKEPELFQREVRPGVGIDPQTRTARMGERYQAEYLRLAEDVSLSAFVLLDNLELLEKLFSNRLRFQLGGQQCLVTASRVRTAVQFPEAVLPVPEIQSSGCVKYVLLTPACYNQGWLPPFVDPVSGRVMLKVGKLPRLAGESRDAWRRRNAAELPTVAARLTAARIGGAQVISGWRMGNLADKKAGPRPTRLLVPAGSVYYFEADTTEAAQQLAAALAGKFLTDMGGEYGCGLGICTTWEKEN